MAALLVTASVFWVFSRVPDPGPGEAPPTALRHVRLLDPRSGEAVPGHTVLLRGGKIFRVLRPWSPVPVRQSGSLPWLPSQSGGVPVCLQPQ